MYNVPILYFICNIWLCVDAAHLTCISHIYIKENIHIKLMALFANQRRVLRDAVYHLSDAIPWSFHFYLFLNNKLLACITTESIYISIRFAVLHIIRQLQMSMKYQLLLEEYIGYVGWESHVCPCLNTSAIGHCSLFRLQSLNNPHINNSLCICWPHLQWHWSQKRKKRKKSDFCHLKTLVYVARLYDKSDWWCCAGFTQTSGLKVLVSAGRWRYPP